MLGVGVGVGRIQGGLKLRGGMRQSRGCDLNEGEDESAEEECCEMGG